MCIILPWAKLKFTLQSSIKGNKHHKPNWAVLYITKFAAESQINVFVSQSKLDRSGYFLKYKGRRTDFHSKANSPALSTESQQSPIWYYCSSVRVCLVAKSSPALLWPQWPQPARLPFPWNSLGKNTGVGCHFLPHGIFLTQGSNTCLLHWQEDSWPTELPGKPNMVLEDVSKRRAKFWLQTF